MAVAILARLEVQATPCAGKEALAGRVGGSVVVLAVQALVPGPLRVEAEHGALPARVAVADHVARGRLLLLRLTVAGQRSEIPLVEKVVLQRLGWLTHRQPPFRSAVSFPLLPAFHSEVP